MAPIDPFKKHRELCGTQGHGAVCGLRPDKSSSLQTLGKKHSPSPLHHRIFTRSPARPRNTNSCRKRISRSCVCTRPRARQILCACRSRGEPHLHSCRQCDHRLIKRSMSARALHRPPAHALRRCDVAQLDLDHFTGLLGSEALSMALRTARSVGNTVGVLTVTGSILAASPAACGFSNPRR